MTGPADWAKQTYGFNWLRKQATDHGHLTSAMDFLQAVGVVPADSSFRRKTRWTSNSLPASAIPALYLAEFANDWDSVGESSPVDFMEAVEFEVAGTSKRDVVAETLAELGAIATPDIAIAA